MKRLVLFISCLLLFLPGYTQQPAPKAVSAEMRQQLDAMRKDLADMEAEFKRVEQSDPEKAAFLRSQISSTRNILTAMEKAAGVSGRTPPIPSVVKSPVPKALKTTPSSIVPVVLKQSVTPPTPAQARDRLFWFKGKKVNDSTLITARSTLVQYSKNKGLLIIQPEIKKDPFASMISELKRHESRKEELAEFFEKAEDGFLYYPYILQALEGFDVIFDQYSKVLGNTVSIPMNPDFFASHIEADPYLSASGHGPQPTVDLSDTVPSRYLRDLPMSVARTDPARVREILRSRIDRAAALFAGLPSVSDFLPPPLLELGACTPCDTGFFSRQAQKEERWFDNFWGKEKAVQEELLMVYRILSMSSDIDRDHSIELRTEELKNKISARMKQKERILLEKYSNNIQQAPLVNRILLANERQKQLMGFYDESDSIESLENTFLNLFTLYDKFLAEQASQRNHVQILNSLPLYLGLVRQAFILGYSEVKGRPIDPMYEEAKASYLKYNRFSLSLDYDFGLEQRSSSSELQFQATGSLGTANKTYMRIVPDSCWFKTVLYDFKGEGGTLNDISIYLDVKSGTKSYRDEDNKLVTQSYSGPLSYPLLFPDFKIDFCDNSQYDSVFITGFAADENVLAAGAVHPNGPYRQDMLYYLNMLFYSDVLPNKAADFEKMATDILNKVAEIQATIPAPTALGRLRQAYLGKRENDGFRKKIRDAQVSQLAKIPFYAYSRQQVMTDVRHDVKKRDVGSWRVTKGQIHMRIEHEPVE